MKRILLGAVIAFALATPALAQTYQDTGGTAVPAFVPVAPGVGPIGTTAHPMQVTGILSASFSGFTPTPAYAQLTVGASSARVALPSGTVVIVYNTGANAAFVTLGNGSVVATTAGDVVQPNSWLAFTVGAATNLAAIETAGATTLNISGGAGLPTGAGGGSGGGGSVPTGSAGAPSASVVTVQGPTSGGTAVPISAASLPLPSGAMPSSGGSVGISGTLPAFAATPTVNLGTIGSAATAANQTAGNTALSTINTTLGSPFQAGGSIGNTTFAVTQSASSSLKAQVDPLTIASWGLESGTVPGAAPTNTMLVGGKYTSGGVTLTTGQAAPLQLNASGQALVNCANCSGSGAIATDEASLAYGAANSFAPIGGQYSSSITSLASGQAGFVAMTAARSMHVLDDNSASIITDLATLHTDLGTLNTTAANPLAAGANVIGYVSNDPCAYQAKTTAAFSGSTGEFVIIPNTASKKTTICSISYRIASAGNVSIVTGTGTTCGTSAAALSGSTTAVSGLPEAANGGEALGSGGATVMASSLASGDICVLQSGTALVAGSATYVQN